MQARLSAGQAWIALHFAERRVALINRLVTEARASAQAARGRLSAGGAGVDDAIAAEVEAARLEDRVADVQATIAGARAELRRWIGAGADEQLANEEPAFLVDPDHLRHHLLNHPELAIYQAETDVAAANVNLAQASRLPSWSWELSYGRRDPSFGDMASVEVRVGLPLFQGGRQDQIVAARRDDVQRVGAEREAAEREHTAMLEAELAEYAAVTANLARARDVRLSLAEQRASAAQTSFASGGASLSQLIEARRGALEANLDIIDLEERQARLGAQLTLQYSEPAP